MAGTEKFMAGIPIPAPQKKDISIRSTDSIEPLARLIRNEWDQGQQTIAYLTAVLEEHGFIVIMSKLPTVGGCDGMQAIV